VRRGCYFFFGRFGPVGPEAATSSA
jgi:hypothetical protein